MPKKSQKKTTIIGELHNEYCKKYKSKKACKGFEISDMPDIPCLFEKLVEKYNTCCSGSKQNWRNEIQPNISTHNKGEKVLEKAVVIEMQKKGKLDWVNQVPIASGVFSSRADSKRAVDLVHKVRDDVYEFIELKTELKTDNPVYAALEILLYGIVYIFYRKYAMEQYEKNKGRDLLLATSVVLVVAAPENYYPANTQELARLKKIEDALLEKLGKWVPKVLRDVRMTFRFDSFKYSCDASLEKNVANFLHKTSLFN